MEEEKPEKYKLVISKKTFHELQNLTEEKEFHKIVVNALHLYHTILKYQAKNHKLTMLPVHMDGTFDEKRPLVFLTESLEEQNDE